MITEKDFDENIKASLEERIERIQNIISAQKNVRGFELGVLLALTMSKELRDKMQLGSASGDLVASWNGKYPDSIIEEAISCAKQFITNPATLAQKIKEGALLRAKKSKNEPSTTNE